MQTDTLEQMPFPPLKWNNFFWTGDVVLPSWAGFQSRRGDYASLNSTLPSNGTVLLLISSQDDKVRTSPTNEQIAAFQFLMDNEAVVAASVVDSLVKYCPGHSYDGDEEMLFIVNGKDDLRPLIGLSSVHVLDVFKDGEACIGFEFGCVWDEEHGAGVMTHHGRVIATGQADCSFVEWIARQGLERMPRHV